MLNLLCDQTYSHRRYRPAVPPMQDALTSALHPKDLSRYTPIVPCIVYEISNNCGSVVTSTCSSDAPADGLEREPHLQRLEQRFLQCLPHRS